MVDSWQLCRKHHGAQVAGLSVGYHQPILHASPETVGAAVLTPVPEPGAPAMLLCGLALAIGARIHRARPAPQRGPG